MNFPLLKGNLFYKYRSDIGENGRNLDLITSQSAYFASADSFNDPFDCSPRPEASSMEQLRALVEAMSADPVVPKRMSDAYAQQLKANPDKFLAFVQDKAMTNKFYKDFVKQYSIFCLSTDPTNRLLWSHYGNCHTGFAVELEIREPFTLPAQDGWCTNDGEFLPLEVKYRETRPSLGMAHGGDTDLFLVKDKCWKYEDEFRILMRGGPRAIRFEEKRLRSVILGARVAPEVESAVKAAVEYFNENATKILPIYKVEMSSSKYSLNIPSHPLYSDMNE